MKRLFNIALISLLLSSCTLVDVLDKVPPYEADLEGAITNANKVELALTGVYSNLPAGAYDSRDIIAEGSFKAGMMRKPEWWKKGNAVWYYERYWPTLSSNGSTEWSYDYELIKNANFLLSAIDNINDFEGNRKEEIIGELHFLKALVYNRMMLRFTEHWDRNSKYGLIIRNDLPTINNVKKPRSSVEESYQMILDELEKAIDKSGDFTNSFKGSNLAAKALKAKVLFQMQEYNDCITLINQIISEATILKNESTNENGLAKSYSTLFTDYASTNEILFARGFGNSDASGLETRITSYSSGKWGPTQECLDLLENDPRYNDIIGDEVIVDYRYGVPGTEYKNFTIKKLVNASNDLPIIFIRMAELYLIKAEAIYRNGGSYTDAYAPIKIIRDRVSAPELPHSTQQEIEEAICNEWLLELSFENSHEYFALRRFGNDWLLKQNIQLTEALQKAIDQGADDEEQYRQRIKDRRISAIPSNETTGNPVDQNPGY